MDRKTLPVGRWLLTLALATVMMAPVGAAAQSVTSTDIQRLQDEVYQASSDLSRSEVGSDRASRLRGELDDLRDEVIYLKVRLRREGSVPRADYLDVRDRLSAIRAEARGESAGTERRGAWTGGSTSGGVSGGTAGSTSTSGGGYGTTTRDRDTTTRDRDTTTRDRDTRRSSGDSAIPVGQELDVRLQTRLSSDTAEVEDRFEATTVADLYRGNDVLIPAGSLVRGVVRSVDRATRTDRRGALTVSFDQITIRGRTYPMRGTVTEALQSEGIKGEAGRIGAGAGVGAIIGGILGGVKGALLGVLIGGGGTIAATEGKDVTLEPGTLLRVQLDDPPNIR